MQSAKAKRKLSNARPVANGTEWSRNRARDWFSKFVYGANAKHDLERPTKSWHVYLASGFGRRQAWHRLVPPW